MTLHLQEKSQIPASIMWYWYLDNQKMIKHSYDTFKHYIALLRIIPKSEWVGFSVAFEALLSNTCHMQKHVQHMRYKLHSAADKMP